MENFFIELMKLGAQNYLVNDVEFLDLVPSVVNRLSVIQPPKNYIYPEKKGLFFQK